MPRDERLGLDASVEPEIEPEAHEHRMMIARADVAVDEEARAAERAEGRLILAAEAQDALILPLPERRDAAADAQHQVVDRIDAQIRERVGALADAGAHRTAGLAGLIAGMAGQREAAEIELGLAAEAVEHVAAEIVVLERAAEQGPIGVAPEQMAAGAVHRAAVEIADGALEL